MIIKISQRAGVFKSIRLVRLFIMLHNSILKTVLLYGVICKLMVGLTQTHIISDSVTVYVSSNIKLSPYESKLYHIMLKPDVYTSNKCISL